MGKLKVRLSVTFVAALGFVCLREVPALSQVATGKVASTSSSSFLLTQDLSSKHSMEAKETFFIPVGEEGYTPEGVWVERNGNLVYPNGLKLEIVRRPEINFIGFQYILPNGTRLKPGEKAVLPTGETIEQPIYPRGLMNKNTSP